MDDADTEPAQQSHWRRWTGDSGPFYRACAVYPFEAFSDAQLPAADDGKPDLEITAGVTRSVLRNLPLVVLAVLAVYVPAKVVEFVAEGRLQVPAASPDPRTIGLLVPVVLIGTLWLYLIYRVLTSGLRGSSMRRTVVFVGTALPLGAGTVHSAYTVWTSAGSMGEPTMTVQAGYFLFVLVTGHLVYDGLVLKTEHLLARLGETGIVTQPAYDEFYAEVTEVLGYTYDVGPVGVPRSIVFALVVALGPLLLPFAFVPFRPWGVFSYTAYNLVTLFVLAVLYDVFVLIYYFVELLRRDILEYQPFHPDEHGGFRDLGRFATRVNVVLFVAGAYVAYRFYAEGVVQLSGGAVSSPLGAVTWWLFFVGPVVAYVCLVVFWLYHSFFRLHRTMKEGRQRRIEELQRKARDENGEPSKQFADLERDVPPWQSLQDAPTWPISRQSLLGIVVVDALPVVVSLFL